MPAIPLVVTFISEYLHQTPTSFDFNSPNAATDIYIPNFNYTFSSNKPMPKLQWLKSKAHGMIANDIEIANQGGRKDTPLLLGCGIRRKVVRSCQLGVPRVRGVLLSSKRNTERRSPEYLPNPCLEMLETGKTII